MHAARIERSARLRRVRGALSAEWLSSLEIVRLIEARTGVRHMALHSDIAELRAPINGLNIECRRVTVYGRRHWEYRAVKRVEQAVFC